MKILNLYAGIGGKKKFLNRTVFNPNTMTYEFEDGSGVVPIEMKIDMGIASENRNKAGHNGLSVLTVLWNWKDRLKKLTPITRRD